MNYRYSFFSAFLSFLSFLFFHLFPSLHPYLPPNLSPYPFSSLPTYGTYVPTPFPAFPIYLHPSIYLFLPHYFLPPPSPYQYTLTSFPHIPCLLVSTVHQYPSISNITSLSSLSSSPGFGIEPDSHYPQWRKVYGGLGRHKELTDSFHKYVDGKNTVLLNFHSGAV